MTKPGKQSVSLAELISSCCSCVTPKMKQKESSSREEGRWENRSQIHGAYAIKLYLILTPFDNKLTICRWQKDEVAGMQGKARRPDGIKTVVKVEKGGRVHIGQESRARSVEGRGRRDLGPEIWDERKMTENGNRVLEGVHAGCRSLRSPIVVCRFHPFEQ